MTQGRKLSDKKIKRVKKLSKDHSTRHIAKILDINRLTVRKYSKKRKIKN